MSATQQPSIHSLHIRSPLSLSLKSNLETHSQARSQGQTPKAHIITINSKSSKIGHVNLSLNRGISPDSKVSTENKTLPELSQEPKKLVAYRPRKRSPQAHLSSKFKLDVAEPISSVVLKGFKQIQAMILLIVQAMDTFFIIIETFFLNFMKEVDIWVIYLLLMKK